MQRKRKRLPMLGSMVLQNFERFGFSRGGEQVGTGSHYKSSLEQISDGRRCCCTTRSGLTWRRCIASWVTSRGRDRRGRGVFSEQNMPGQSRREAVLHRCLGTIPGICRFRHPDYLEQDYRPRSSG